MKQYPAVPRAEEAPPELFASGHLWLQEQVDGAHLRFRLRESGRLQFGGRTRTFRADGGTASGAESDDVPLPYRHAVRHVRESFDREALRNTVSDVESVVFFAEATVRNAIDYDWERTPPLLGFDVWDADEERFLPPDSVERVFERLGLRPVNTFRKEVRAADFDVENYEIPQSAWYDGPAAGVVVRNKTGQRAAIPDPAVRPERDDSDPASGDSDPATAPADELVERYVTRERVERVASELDAGRGSPAFDAVFERVVEAIAREERHRLFHERASVDLRAFRSAAAERTQELLGDA
jgi:hypothetical protein